MFRRATFTHRGQVNRMDTGCEHASVNFNTTIAELICINTDGFATVNTERHTRDC